MERADRPSPPAKDGPELGIDFRTFLEQVPNPVLLVGSDGRIVLANPAAGALLGYAPEALAGREIEVLLPPERREGHREMRDRYLEAPDPRPMGIGRDLVAVHRDGTEIPVEISLGPIAREGGVVVAATLLDLRERRRSETELAGYTRELERSNRELEEFAYVASHDLQEPLRKVRAFADRLELALPAELDPKARDSLDRMRRAATRMQGLIEGLLAFSRVTTRARAPERVDLGKVFEGVLSDLSVAIEESGARVVVPHLPAVSADPLQMGQLFQNLLANAMKFRDPGRAPEIRVEAEVVELEKDPRTRLRPRRVRITVADNGIGFEDRYAERIFEVFQRLHGAGEYPGSGIGLAICRKIAERHGGSIRASGRPGEGARFTVELPAHGEREAGR